MSDVRTRGPQRGVQRRCYPGRLHPLREAWGGCIATSIGWLCLALAPAWGQLPPLPGESREALPTSQPSSATNSSEDSTPSDASGDAPGSATAQSGSPVSILDREQRPTVESRPNLLDDIGFPRQSGERVGLGGGYESAWEPNNNVAHRSSGTMEIQFEALDEATAPPVITALTASHDGRYLAAAGDDHAIRIVDVYSGQNLQTVAGHVDWIRSLAFYYPEAEVDALAPVLYSSGNDGRVLEWKYEFPVSSRELIRLPYSVSSLTISSSQQLMAIGGFSDEILIWDLEGDRLLQRLPCDCGDQRCVRFSPDGKLLLCAGRDGMVHVWETQSGEEVVEYRAHRTRIHAAAFSKDGSEITSAGADRRVVRYDLVNREVRWEREIRPSKLKSLCLINQDLIAVAGADNKIRLFDVTHDRVAAELEGHSGTVAIMAACGDRLASGSFDTTVRIWDLHTVEDSTRVGTGKPVMHSPFTIDPELQVR